MAAQRVLVAFCPDWPVIAAGCPPSALVAVIGPGAGAGVVAAASPAAEAAGVRLGMRRREAQGHCPGLELLERDEAAEARRWEPVVATVEAFAPGVEVLSPGSLALAAKGPSRYFGGELAVAAKVVATVEQAVSGPGLLVPSALGSSSGSVPSGGPGLSGNAGGHGFGDLSKAKGAAVLRAGARRARPVPRSGPWAGCCRVGVADGLFAAGVAACMARPDEPLLVPEGAAAAFLAPLELAWLSSGRLACLVSSAGGPGVGAGDQSGFARLVSLLERLGVRTFGELAALPSASVLGRFGREGEIAHRLARGLPGRPVQGRRPPPDWEVAAELSPPADHLQAAVFVGRALAEKLHANLAAKGLICTRLAIEAETERGVKLRRSWRHEGSLSAAAIGERARWQLV